METGEYHIDGLMQERRNSIANALELRLPCTYPSKYRTVGQATQIMPLVSRVSDIMYVRCNVARYKLAPGIP